MNQPFSRGGYGGGGGGYGGGGPFGGGGGGMRFGGLTGGSPPPRDILILLAVLFGTFSLQFFSATAGLLGWLRLTPLVWHRGLVWQLFTYPYVGAGPASIWILLQLLILYWFSKDVYYRLGRKNFWKLMTWATVGGAVLAVLVNLATSLLSGGYAPGADFQLMQGQYILLSVIIAAFATLFGDATILLFFVLPVKARWFLPIELLFAFISYLSSKDLAGFVGICSAVGITWVLLTGPAAGRILKSGPRQLWLRLQHWWMRRKLDNLRKKRNFKVVPGEGRGRGGEGGNGGGGRGGNGHAGGGDVRQGPWVN